MVDLDMPLIALQPAIEQYFGRGRSSLPRPVLWIDKFDLPHRRVCGWIHSIRNSLSKSPCPGELNPASFAAIYSGDLFGLF
jgi:hypothetical protein